MPFSVLVLSLVLVSIRQNRLAHAVSLIALVALTLVLLRRAQKNEFVFSLVNSAVNVTLPPFAAECRAAAPLLLGAGVCRCRSICPARGALSSKPAACRSGCQTMGQTDGQTGTRLLHRPCYAYFVRVLLQREQHPLQSLRCGS